jgi:two-component system alkaline phosphatase synthesis response regulator PhoP
MQKRRILIVDDEPGFIKLLKLTLEKTGRYRVWEENDPTKAVDAAMKFMPDLILLDIVMPRIDGGEVARQIPADPLLRETPLIFLTATVLKKSGEPMEIEGFPALAKPIGIKELLEMIEANLSASVGAS